MSSSQQPPRPHTPAALTQGMVCSTRKVRFPRGSRDKGAEVLGSSIALLLRTGRTTAVSPPQDAGSRQDPRLSMCFSFLRDTCHVRGQSLCQGLPLSKECAELLGSRILARFIQGRVCCQRSPGLAMGQHLGLCGDPLEPLTSSGRHCLPLLQGKYRYGKGTYLLMPLC